MTELRLPELIDCKGIQEEMGLKRAAAEALMRQVERVEIPGVRRWYVKRADVLRALEKERAA
ncbi:MAG: hypothetical protein ACRDY6_09375 [Acidimicrobiia bacterium]